jgi:hypothetical protein
MMSDQALKSDQALCDFLLECCHLEGCDILHGRWPLTALTTDLTS